MLQELGRYFSDWPLGLQAALAQTLIQACGLDAKRNSNAQKTLDWRRGGAATGKNAGHFAAAMKEVSSLASACRTRS